MPRSPRRWRFKKIATDDTEFTEKELTGYTRGTDKNIYDFIISLPISVFSVSSVAKYYYEEISHGKVAGPDNG
jgi:hypothetical protein